MLSGVKLRDWLLVLSDANSKRTEVVTWGRKRLGFIQAQSLRPLDLHDPGIMHHDLHNPEPQRPNLALHEAHPGRCDLFRSFDLRCSFHVYFCIKVRRV